MGLCVLGLFSLFDYEWLISVVGVSVFLDFWVSGFWVFGLCILGSRVFGWASRLWVLGSWVLRFWVSF